MPEYFNANTNFKFMKYPKFLNEKKPYSELPLHSKLLYAHILDLAALSKTNGWTDKEGHIKVYLDKNKISALLNCKPDTAEGYFMYLEDVDLIVRDIDYPETVYPKIVTSL